jgi:flagellar hook-associated protein 2
VINYNANTDTLSTLLSRINNSNAGVTVSYDSANNRFNVTNNNTGDVGMGLSDTSGNLLAAMGLTSASGGSFVHGKNAQFTINNGPPLTSLSNTLDSSVTGISGFSVTVNSETAETLQIQSNTASMQTAIQSMITAYNQVQTDITTDTKITSSGGTTTASVLSGNNEVTDWASNLQSMAFDSVTGVIGSIQSLNDMGIGFTDTTGQLSITDSTKLANALTNTPQDVQNFFLTGSTGFVSRMYTGLTNDLGANSSAQGTLAQANTDLASRITALQAQLSTEQTNLTNSFITMLDAQSTAQSESTTLTNAFLNPNNNNNSCWVARAVYGAGNPRWLVFRFWLLKESPAWFRWLYLRHGERFASWLDDKPRVRHAIRRWMDKRVARVLHP